MKKVIVPYMILIFGFCMLGFACYGFYKSTRIYLNGEKAIGKVVRIEITRTSNRRQHRQPVIKFKTKEGKEMEFISEAPNLGGGYKESDSVEIIYNKKNPVESEINSFYTMWAFGIAYLILSGTCLYGFFDIQGRGDSKKSLL
ncbi:MAG: DUF3592 domain-containing protein [Candidatus Riflebacteria bacterium]|nr:DUF3592 domain-containing protein [Candidatus Riflebacteria bacterium]